MRVEAYLPTNFSDSDRSGTLKTNPTAKRSSRRGFKTAALILPPSSGTSGSSFEQDTPESTKALRTWLRLAFPARETRSPASGSENQTPVISGPKPLESFAALDPVSRSWRMFLGYSPLEEAMGPEGECLPPFSGIWPKQGLMLNGQCWELTIAAPRTGERDCGYWPSPRGSDGEKGGPNQRGSKGDQMLPSAVMWPTPKGSPSGPDFARTNRPESGGDDLATSVARGGTPTRQTWPTPTANDDNKSPEAHLRMKQRMGERDGTHANRTAITSLQVRIKSDEGGGQLNPEWVCWLMNWPCGWTSLEPLSEERYLAWLQASRTVLTDLGLLEMDR